jgi:uncharacterized membrane protein YgaE (UPF0421/DUF939 family)
MQMVLMMLGISAAVFVIYYLPFVTKDLKKISEQNEEIKNILQKIESKLNNNQQ